MIFPIRALVHRLLLGIPVAIVPWLVASSPAVAAGSVAFPVVSSYYWPERPATGQAVNFSVTAIDQATGLGNADGLTYAWDFDGDGTTDSTASTPTYTGFATAGDHLVHVTLTDTAGHSVTEGIAVHVHTGNLAPQLLATLVSRPLVGAPAWFSAYDRYPDDSGASSTTWDFGDGATATSNTSHVFTAATDRVVIGTATDSGGKTGAVAAMVHPHATNEPPAISYLTAAEPTDGAASFGSGVSDDGTAWNALKYHWDFGDGTSSDAAGTSYVDHAYTDGAGEHLVELTVTDGASPALSSSAARVVRAGDTGGPTLAIAAPASAGGGLTLNSGTATATTGVTKTLAVMATADSEAEACPTDRTYDWDLGDGTHAAGASVSHAWIAPGRHLVTVTATSSDGTIHRAAVVVQVGAVSPPVAYVPTNAYGGTLDGSIYTPRAGVQYTLPAEALIQAPAGALSATWDFGDGTTGTGLTAVHTWATSGTKIVTVTLTDRNGATDTEAAALEVISANAAPVISSYGFLTTDLVAPGTAVTPIAFAYAHDPDRSGSLYYSGDLAYEGIVSASWDFGDGTTETGLHPSHAYASPGDYDVRVTVTDADGASASDVQTVHVRADLPSVPPSTMSTSYLCATGSGGGGDGGSSDAGGGASSGGGAAGGTAGKTDTTPNATAPTDDGTAAPTSPAPVGPTVPAVPTGTTPAAVMSALGALINHSPSYQDAADGRVEQAFTAPSPGTLTIRWYLSPRGSKTGAPIASGGKSFTRASKGTVTVKLTKRGRKELARTNRLSVKAVVTFTPADGSPRSTSKTLVIRRG